MPTLCTNKTDCLLMELVEGVTIKKLFLKVGTLTLCNELTQFHAVVHRLRSGAFLLH
jgi:hypothetical protein